jgi:hypothetical protein
MNEASAPDIQVAARIAGGGRLAEALEDEIVPRRAPATLRRGAEGVR